MAILFPQVYLDFLAFFAGGFLLIYLYFQYCFKYWEKKKVPFLKPTFPLGNNTVVIPKGIALGLLSKKFYDEFKKQGHKFGGVYAFIQPILFLRDPDYIKDVLTKDFQNFVDRGIYYNEKYDPISSNLFTQDGAKWRHLRVKFSPTFTSGKMKMMFNVVVDCSKNMIQSISNYSEEKADIDILEVAGCFTTDVIGSVAFGIECNSFKEPNAEFRRMGKRIFTVDFWISLNISLGINFPHIAKRIGAKSINEDVSVFFYKIVKDVVEHREKNNIRRPDFLQMLIDMKNSSDESERLTMDEITAQVFLFFTAGFETSSTTMQFFMLEISRNQLIQDKLRHEIKEVLGRHNNEITYDSLAEMKYLTQCIDETLRMYPPVTTLNRVCTKDYTLRETDVTIERGTGIMLSTYGLHRDPDYYPNPDQFDPERFTTENKAARHSCVYLPFGEGPRNCIGLRFGIMQAKIGVIEILKNFKILPSPKTVYPPRLDPDTFLMNVLDKVYVKAIKLSE